MKPSGSTSCLDSKKWADPSDNTTFTHRASRPSVRKGHYEEAIAVDNPANLTAVAAGALPLKVLGFVNVKR